MNEGKLHGCKCRNCGIELITQSRSADTFCRFCGAPALIAQDYEKTSEPELVIPFETDKYHARSIFLRYLSKRPLLSSVFSQKVKSGNFAAIYIPVCLADINVNTDINISDEIGYKSTERMTSSAKNMSSSMSRNANDYLLRDIGPFDFSGAVAYGKEHSEVPYERSKTEPLEEILANQIDEISTSCVKEANRIFAQQEYGKRIDSCKKADITYSCKNVLVPLWVLNAQQNGYTHQIFINGQSGKIVGEPPVSAKRAAAIFGIVAAACTVIGEFIWMAVNGL